MKDSTLKYFIKNFNSRLKGGISQNVTSEFFQKLNLLNRPEYVDTSPYRRVHRVLDNAGYNTLKLMQDVSIVFN